MLNVNQRVTALAAGRLSPESGRDCLLYVVLTLNYSSLGIQ
jgi:hypothetical protein